MDPVAGHYGIPGLVEAILDALRSQGKDVNELVPEDLSAVDEFHIRGREATVELAQLAECAPGLRVLDVGSGLGGSARFLAAQHGCRVTGIDITPEFCDGAARLSQLVGLDGATQFQCGSALELPFPDASFDVVWTQHVQMNIADKRRLYGEIRRVLCDGGRFAFHDILAGPGGAPHYPVHWAETPELSFLIGPDDFLTLLERTGFRVAEWRDTTVVARAWYLAAFERRKDGDAPPAGIHLLMGRHAPAKFENFARNLVESRLTVYMGLLEKA